METFKIYLKKLTLFARRFLTKNRVDFSRRPGGKKRLVKLKTLLHLLVLPLTFFYYELLLRLLNRTGLFHHLFYLLIFSFAYGMLFNLATLFFTRKINKRVTLGIMGVTAVIFIVECMIRSTFQVYMTVGTVTTGTEHVVGGFFGLLVSSILHGILAIILYAIPCALYLVFGNRKVRAYQYKAPMAIPVAAAFLLFFLFGSLGSHIGSAKLLYSDQYNFNTAIETFGLMTGFRLDAKLHNKTASFVIDEPEPPKAENPDETAGAGENPGGEENPGAGENGEAPENQEPVPAANPYNTMDIDFANLQTDRQTIADLNKYVNSLTPTKKNAYTGLFEGKNLILICAEALSDAIISPELTPTLYRMTHNGFYFSDYYQPAWGGSTITGECSFLFGLVPTHSVETTLDTIGHNMYMTMGNQLQRLGYNSAAFHSGKYDYYDRQKTHSNFGYTTWLGQGNGLENITSDYPEDEEFISKTIDVCMASQPFSLYYMTLSGHCAYKASDRLVTENMQRILDVTGDRYKDTTRYYLCYQMELEKAMTTLIAKLEAAGIADNTVICLTADHYPYGLAVSQTFGNTEDYVADLYGYSPNYPWERDRNSLIIWSGCLETSQKDKAVQISAPVYSPDILPTLSNLFGLSYDSRLLVGRDVFDGETTPLCLWNNYSWLTTEGWYDSASHTFIPKPGCSVDENYVNRMNAVVSNKIAFSKMAISEDYYTYLFGPDEVPGTSAIPGM